MSRGNLQTHTTDNMNPWFVAWLALCMHTATAVTYTATICCVTTNFESSVLMRLSVAMSPTLTQNTAFTIGYVPGQLQYAAFNSPVASSTTLSSGTSSVIVRTIPVDDTIPEGTHYGTMTLTATSGDPVYVAAGTVEFLVEIIDNDYGPVLSDYALAVTELSQVYFTVKLSLAPGTDVTVGVTSLEGLLEADPASITFTSSTWNTPQNITVTAVDVEECPSPGGLDNLTVAVTATANGNYLNKQATAVVTVTGETLEQCGLPCSTYQAAGLCPWNYRDTNASHLCPYACTLPECCEKINNKWQRIFASGLSYGVAFAAAFSLALLLRDPSEYIDYSRL